MINKILITCLIFFSMFSCVSGDTQLNYTDTYETYTTVQTSNNETYQLYTDNSFDIITIYQTTVLLPGTYYNNISFMVYENTYKIENKYIIENSLIPIFFNVEHITTVYNNDVFRSEQIEEYKTYRVGTGSFKTEMYLGTYQESDEIGNKIYMEQLVSAWNKIYTYNTYVCDMELSDMSNIKNINIEKNTFSSLLVTLHYKKIGTYSEKYYINQLSSPLQFIYTGLKIIDDDKSILNVMLLSEYILNIFLFVIGVITKSFFTIFFIFLIAGVPTIAFSNSHTQQQFINKSVEYYIKTFDLMFKFLNTIFKFGLKMVELIIPF